MDNNHSRWQSFQFRFNSSAEIVCNQLNFKRKIFVFSGILAKFLVYAIIRLIRISAEFSPAVHIFFQIADWGVVVYGKVAQLLLVSCESFATTTVTSFSDKYRNKVTVTKTGDQK